MSLGHSQFPLPTLNFAALGFACAVSQGVPLLATDGKQLPASTFAQCRSELSLSLLHVSHVRSRSFLDTHGSRSAALTCVWGVNPPEQHTVCLVQVKPAVCCNRRYLGHSQVPLPTLNFAALGFACAVSQGVPQPATVRKQLPASTCAQCRSELRLSLFAREVVATP